MRGKKAKQIRRIVFGEGEMGALARKLQRRIKRAYLVAKRRGEDANKMLNEMGGQHGR